MIFTTNHMVQFMKTHLGLALLPAKQKLISKTPKEEDIWSTTNLSSKNKNDNNFVGIRLVLIGLIVITPYNQTHNTGLNFKTTKERNLKNIFLLGQKLLVFNPTPYLLIHQLHSL